MIISFGWTSEYLPPKGPKEVTRRVWKERTLKAWQKAWDEGRKIHDAVNRSLSYGGNRIGKVELIARPYLEKLSDMPDSDVIKEGGMVPTKQEYIDKYFEGNRNKVVAVVRFKYQPNEGS
ncbi:MAG: hypothetical protein CMB89_10305 [Flammeovirgaceae bacterium]|nr:hypothetical protein [Flammeovirgaceae bacterium]|tara:strand:- start:266 stop:625 length:360 start_codon:yes stop_codon:yes gene_type:complete